MKDHTPGPWGIGKTGGTVVSNHPISSSVKNTGHDDVEYYGGHLIAESILSEADALLIAAAPDLLKACEKLLDVLEGFPCFSHEENLVLACWELKNVIAGAKGYKGD